jgi:WD40 repeat protein
MDIQGGNVLTGSADHGLKIHQIKNGFRVKELYTKRFGHTEWVTVCAFLPDGRVISGGMDGRLLLWASGGVSCTECAGHTSSIASMAYNKNRSLFLTGAYDKKVLVWGSDFQSATKLPGSFPKPVNCLAFAPMGPGSSTSIAATGDGSGAIKVWDLTALKGLAKQVAAHKGPLTSVQWTSAHTVATIAQDGMLRLWDVRSGLEHPVGEVQALGERIALTSLSPVWNSSSSCSIDAVDDDDNGGSDCQQLIVGGASPHTALVDVREWHPYALGRGLSDDMRNEFVNVTHAVGSRYAVVASGRMGKSGLLSCFDLRDGSVKWRIEGDIAEAGAIEVIRQDRGTLITGNDQGNLGFLHF